MRWAPRQLRYGSDSVRIRPDSRSCSALPQWQLGSESALLSTQQG